MKTQQSPPIKFVGAHSGKGSEHNTFLYIGDKAKQGFYHTTGEDTVTLKRQQQAASYEAGGVLWNILGAPKATVENQKLQNLYDELVLKATADDKFSSLDEVPETTKSS